MNAGPCFNYFKPNSQLYSSQKKKEKEKVSYILKLLHPKGWELVNMDAC